MLCSSGVVWQNVPHTVDISWLIGADKTVMNIGIHLKYNTPIWFQEFLEIPVINMKKNWKSMEVYFSKVQTPFSAEHARYVSNVKGQTVNYVYGNK